MKQYISEYQSYSFLTKSAKLKLAKRKGKVMDGYSFLTKSAKLKPEADLWRIEFEMKGPKVADTWTACAEKLLIHKIEFPQATKGTDIIICLALEEHPTYFEYLNRNQRAKYRKMMNQTEGTDLMPVVHQAIKQSEQRLHAELNQWMPGGMNS